MSNKSFNLIHKKDSIVEVHLCYGETPIGVWSSQHELTDSFYVCFRPADYIIPMTPKGYVEAMDWLIATKNKSKIGKELSGDGYTVVSLANHLRQQLVKELSVEPEASPIHVPLEDI